MIIPISIIAVIAWRLWANRQSGVMTFERKVIFKKLLRSKDPVMLQKFSNLFAKEGLKDQATVLANRAQLRSHPDQVLQQRQAALKTAMASTDPDAIDKIADGFAMQGATNTAEYLYAYAESIRTITKIPPIVAPPPAPQAPVEAPQVPPNQIEPPAPAAIPQT